MGQDPPLTLIPTWEGLIRDVAFVHISVQDLQAQNTELYKLNENHQVQHNQQLLETEGAREEVARHKHTVVEYATKIAKQEMQLLNAKAQKTSLQGELDESRQRWKEQQDALTSSMQALHSRDIEEMAKGHCFLQVSISDISHIEC